MNLQCCHDIGTWCTMGAVVLLENSSELESNDMKEEKFFCSLKGCITDGLKT